MSVRQQLVRLSDIISGGLNHVVEVGMFLVVAIFAVASITEISARNNYLGYLLNQVNSINQKLAQNNGSSTDKFTEEAISTLRREVQVYEYLQSRLEALVSVGADNKSQTLTEIRRDSEGIRFNIQNEPDEQEPYILIHFFQRYILPLSSDYLLAIAIMTCGAIGASIGSIRNSGHFTWRSILFGLSSGFIIFLAIKGGKNIFLLQAHSQVIQFNPYSSGFFGLLAGMFTEKTFELLNTVTDAIFKKLKKILEE